MKKEISKANPNFFYEKPEERGIDGTIDFIKNGKKYTEKYVYSVPCERCDGCPVYRIDESVTPTAYYCQAGYLIGAFNKAMKDGTIPKNCRVVEVRCALNCN